MLNRFDDAFSRTDPTKADPANYVGNPKKIANLVYSKKYRPSLGNGNVSSGDGYRYRGRGIFHLSGQYNYQQFTNFAQNNLGMTTNFVANPGQLSSNPKAAILSAMWFFKHFVLSEITIDENTTVEQVTSEINTGGAGMQDRKNRFDKIVSNINCQ